eukprot:5354348-Amphidinium_carterae.4
MRKSLSDMQNWGLVLWKMTGKEAFELIPDFRERAERLDLDLCQFPVYVLTSHDLVFPYSAGSDEVLTLSRRARQEIVRQTRQTQALLRNHTGEKESAVYKQEEYIFPEYEDEELEHEPEDIGGEAPGEPDWTPSESERQALQLAHNNLGLRLRMILLDFYDVAAYEPRSSAGHLVTSLVQRASIIRDQCQDCQRGLPKHSLPTWW